MTEKIAVPIVNKSIPTEAKPAEEKAEVESVESKPTPKDPNTLVPELKRLKSGEYWAWEWQGSPQEDPLFGVARDALNIANTSYEDLNAIADIAKLAIMMVGDKPENLYKFLRQELTSVPANGDPIVSLRRNLEIKFKELLKI